MKPIEKNLFRNKMGYADTSYISMSITPHPMETKNYTGAPIENLSTIKLHTAASKYIKPMHIHLRNLSETLS